MHNFARECQSHWHKNLSPHILYVACTIPCESLRHKSNTFHTNISTLHMFISILQKPVSTKQTKHSRKSEAQNLCSKCPPFTQTHAFKRLCHCAIAAAMTVCMVQQPPLPQQTFFQFNVLSTHIMDPRVVDPLLKHTPDAVVHRIQICRIRWPHFWRDKLWRLSLQLVSDHRRPQA